MRLTATLILLICIGLLGGCANPRSLVVGQSTEADVRAGVGKPTDTRVDKNGDKLWEYASGPLGFHTYLVRIGTDGKVKEVTQLLVEERFAKIIPGTMTKAEVTDLLGRPSDETVYGTGLTWSWRYLLGGVSPGYMVVTFNPDDTVNTKITVLDWTGDSRDN